MYDVINVRRILADAVMYQCMANIIIYTFDAAMCFKVDEVVECSSFVSHRALPIAGPTTANKESAMIKGDRAQTEWWRSADQLENGEDFSTPGLWREIGNAIDGDVNGYDIFPWNDTLDVNVHGDCR